MVMLLEGVRAGKVALLSDTPQPFGLGALAVLNPQGWGLHCFLSPGIQQPPPLVPFREIVGGDGPGLTGRQPPAQAPRREWNSSWAAPLQAAVCFPSPPWQDGGGKRNN